MDWQWASVAESIPVLWHHEMRRYYQWNKRRIYVFVAEDEASTYIM